MDFQIYFCVDGILRAKFSEEQPLIPIKFLQEKSQFKSNDLRFWCHWWENNTFFEEGLTVSSFLLCLEPWSEFWTDLTGKNIKEYISEVRKPYSIKKNKNPNDKPLDWVGLSYYTEISTNTEYHHEADSLMDRDINAWFNSPKKMRLTGDWNIHSSYKLTGFIKGEEEQYSIDYTPMNEIANVKLILNNKQWVYFDDWQIKSFFNSDPIFKKNAFGICKLGNKNKMKFLMGEKYHKLRDVVEGFFWWMYVTPARREDFLSDLKEMKDDLDKTLLNEKEDNIIPLFKESDIPNKEKIDEEKKLEVKVVPGAFDSIIESHKRDKNYWEDMLMLAKNEDNVILKIGKIENNKTEEERIFSYILLDKDKPIGTEYKLK